MTYQVHQLTDTIASTLEKKTFCVGIFLDIAQAFNKVWHDGLFFKFLKKKSCQPNYFELLNRTYEIEISLLSKVTLSHLKLILLIGFPKLTT